ncbi:MAG: histidine phosphatase family protein [Clostridiales bacterium]|nr:histidine phosphatase family protein [Clostridiales bacterium]
MRIIIVRHGDPNYERDCLTDLGRKQAEAAAVRLMDEGIEKIYSSCLGRAKETAEVFSEMSGIRPIYVLDFMREIRFGYGEALYESGNPWDEADKTATEGKDLLDPAWRELPFFKENAATQDVDLVCRETDNWMRELGYEREGHYYRCVKTDEQEHTVALFCHGGSGTAMLSRIFNLPFPYLCGIIRMPHTAITIIRMEKSKDSKIMPVLELACDARHIQNIEDDEDTE